MALVASSSSSSYNNNCCYDVFLSFRGEDIRYGFTDHLHGALEAAGYHTFRDKEDLRRGENIEPGLQYGIQNSKCSIIVFSRTYTSSQWCLGELVTILEHKKNCSDYVVIPIFYDVDPSELRKQTGKSAEAFARHEERFKAEIGKVDRWREALKEAANLSGLNLQDEADRYEAKFIEKIVHEVQNKLMSPKLSITPDLIGIDSQVAELNSWLNDGSIDVGILLICGIPGIGKTTIAKCVYNLNLNRFEGRAFIDYVSEISRKPNGLVDLQRALLSQLTRGNREMMIHTFHEGFNRIGEVIRSKRVFLVLDDVDQRNQLDAIIGTRDRFYHGSKIIITTCMKSDQLISDGEISKVHVVRPLRMFESLKLFSRHAFGKDYYSIDEHYRMLSEKIVDHCDGHPLALKILGSSLNKKSTKYWENTIRNLKNNPNGEIHTKLQIGYDSLGDVHVKNLFLDIACFFIGEDKDVVVTGLEERDYCAEIGIQELEDRNLITIESVDEKNHVRMHNLLRDMGREIIRQESLEEPGERSRLWNANESYDVLMEKTGTHKIKGIVLKAWKIIPSPLNSSGERVTLETDAFTKMRKLKLLDLEGVELKGNYQSFPKEIRWLRWSRFPLEHIPNDFRLDKLVVLQMYKSNLKQVWEIPKVRLPQLKILDLSYSQYLTETPDFSLIPELERLILRGCESLVNVHESITNLKKLVYLDMRNCKSIKNLPNIGKIESLKVFFAEDIPMNGWISKSFPSSNPLPRFLVKLSLIKCNLSDEDFCPLGFCSDLSLLTYLNLSKNKISRLPDFIRSLTRLDKLDISSCVYLKSVERLPDIRSYLHLRDCCSLKKVTFESDSCKPERMYCDGTYIDEFEYWFKVFPIESIDEEMIRLLGLESLRDIRINIASSSQNERKSVPIQGFAEHGIFNICLPRNKFPKCFSLPPPPISKNFRGLNIAIVYAYKKCYQMFSPMIQVYNISKDLTWIYRPAFFSYPSITSVFLAGPEKRYDEDVMWLSHWNFGSHELEVGDDVAVSLLVNGCTPSIKVNFKECRVYTVYNADTSNRGGSLISENRREFYEDGELERTYYINGAPFRYPTKMATYSNSFYMRRSKMHMIAKDVFEKNKVMRSCEDETGWTARDGLNRRSCAYASNYEINSEDETRLDAYDEDEYDCEDDLKSEDGFDELNSEDEDEYDDCEDGFDG